MGLDTTHGAWHGAYSAFAGWRNQIATTLGWEIDPSGYYIIPVDGPLIDENTLMGIWLQEPADPIYVLMCHSDCDGLISAEHSAKLADRLAEILPMLPEGYTLDIPAPYWHSRTQRFIDGLRRASSNNEPLEFY